MMKLDVIKVFDLSLASTLSLHDCELVGIDRSHPKRVVFEFEDKEKTRQLIDQYYRGDLSVNPKNFNSTYRELKSRTLSGY